MTTTQTIATATRGPLWAGLAAGPLFLATALGQATVREGFDLTRHPLSLLALGEGGWVQIANFVVSGALVVAAASGMARVPEAGTWGPRLVGVFGVGLVLSGVFVTDAGAGFPAGAPAGAPVMSWHGIAHEIGFGVAVLGWTAACAVVARRFAARRRWGRAAATAGAALATFAVVGWPDPATFSVRLVVASAIQFALVAALSADLLGRRTPRA